MKKLFLSLLIFVPFLSQADLMDDLDQAIRESNASKVRILLQEASLSDIDMLSLIDLSQQTINFHKGRYECSLVRPPASIIDVFTLLGSIYSFFGFIACTGIGLFEGVDDLYHKKDVVISFLGAGGCLASSVLLYKYFSKSSTDFFNTLKANSDNALKTKQLLLRYKPSTQ